MSEERSRLDGWDFLLLSLVLLVLGGHGVLLGLVVPSFGSMYAEFGAVLPVLTRVAIHPGGTLVPALMVVALSVTGLVVRLSGGGSWGRIALGAAVCMGVASQAALIVALYLPLRELATGVAP